MNLDLSEKKQVLNIHSGAIHIENKVDLLSRKAWFYLIYKALPFMDIQTTFSIPLLDLKKAIGYNSKNNKYLKKSLESLVETKVTWNLFGKDNETWGVGSLLSDCEIESRSGIFEYSFSPKIQKRFLNPNMYVKLNLLVSKRFTSKHSLALYCLALDFLNIKNNYGEKNLTIEDLRFYLGLENDEYSRVVDIHRRILKKAEIDINNNSDMNISINPIKNSGRKIIAFKLQMSIKDEHLDFYKPQNKLIDKPNQLKIFENLIAQPLEKMSLNDKPDLISVSNERLQEFYSDNRISLSPKTIQSKLRELKKKLGESFEDYLIFLMEYTKREEKKSGIKNISGFYIGLIKDDLQVSNYMVLSKKNIQKKEESKYKIDEILEERLKKRYTSEMFEDFTNYLLINQDNLEEKITKILNKNLRDKNQFVYDILMKQFEELDIRALTKSNFAIKSAVVGFLKNYKEELEYPETSFDNWRNQIIDEEDIMKLRKEIEKGLKG
jgi:hypothetical protein